MAAAAEQVAKAVAKMTQVYCSFLKELTEQKLIKLKCQFSNIVLELSILALNFFAY